WKVESEDTPRGLRLAVSQATDEFKRMLRQHALRVAEGALGLIGEGSTIVTISNSSTVQHALIHAQRAGRRLAVICAESRPSPEPGGPGEGRFPDERRARGDAARRRGGDRGRGPRRSGAGRRRYADQPRPDQQDRHPADGDRRARGWRSFLYLVWQREVSAAR